MRVQVNGEVMEVDEGVTILGLIEQKGLTPQLVVVECNREIIPRETWKEVILRENDRLEILAFVGGG